MQKIKSSLIAVALVFPSLLFASSASTPPVNLCPDSANNNGWIKVLLPGPSPLAESVPNGPSEPYMGRVLQMCQLAPNAEQIHLRVKDPSIEKSEVVKQIKAVRSKFPDVEIGFVPDNSTTSYDEWGCAGKGWQCVFQASINYMNEINALLDEGKGFNIFTIEESYLEVSGSATADLALQKQCLSGVSNSVCSKPASPSVKYGFVSPSYGGASQYGANAYDYGYPQFYQNKEGHAKFEGTYQWPFPTESLPDPTEQGSYGLTEGQKYYFVDYQSQCTYQPALPHKIEETCAEGGYSIYSRHDPELAASYLAGIILSRALDTKLYPNPNQPQKVFVTLSGAGNSSSPFLGLPGWDISNLNSFNEKLLGYLGDSDNGFGQPAKQVGENDIGFAIWMYQPMLENNFAFPAKQNQAERKS